MNFNKVILAGNATADAELKTSKKVDVEYTSFQLAVGYAKDQTTFFKVAVFGNQGKAVANLITKGRLVLVEGRIKIGTNGRVGIVADQIHLGPPTKESKSRRS